MIKYTYDTQKAEFRDGYYSFLHPDMQEHMHGMVPIDLANTKYASEIHRITSLELERISAAMDVVKRNMFLAIADDNGLELWEKYTGLPPNVIEITSNLRRKYLQAKMTGRHFFLGYHFTNALEQLGGPIRSYQYYPVDETTGDVIAYAAIRFKGALSDPQLDKIVFFCKVVGPAHIQWTLDSPGAGNGWVPSLPIDNDWSAPWLRSDPDQEGEQAAGGYYMTTPWSQLTFVERNAYCKAASDDYDAMSEAERKEIYGDTPTKPDWMENTPGSNEDPPPRFQEFI